MQILEELLLRLKAIGAAEAAGEVDVVTGSVTKSKTAAKEADAAHAGLGRSFGGLASSARSAAGIIGVTGLAFGIDKAVKSAQAFQDTQAQLGTSIRANVHAPARDAAEQMGQFADSLSMHGGFMPVQAMQGMTQFLRVTGDVSKSESDMTLATNIARGAHVDLGRAVRAVTLLEQGRTTGLSKLGISITPIKTAEDALTASGVKATIQQKDHAKALDAVATKQAGMAQVTHEYSGAMATYSRTSAGGTTNLANSMEVLAQKVGALLLPIISTLVGVLQKIVGPLGAILNIVKPMLPIVIGLALAWGAYKGVMVLASAVTFVMQGALAALTLVATLQTAGVEGLALAWGSLDAAMQANVIGLIVVAIAALVLGIIYAYNHVKWFRDFVNDAWHLIKTVSVDVFKAVKGAIVDVFDWVKQHWYVALFLGPFGALIAVVMLVISHFKTFKAIAVDVFNAIKGAAHDVIDWIGDHWKLLVTILSGPLRPLVLIALHFNAIKHVVTEVVDWVIHEFNRMVKFIEGLPGRIGSLVKKIPVLGSLIGAGGSVLNAGGSVIHSVTGFLGGLAGGGSVMQSGPYLVGERGPEIVTLPRGAYVTSNDQVGSSGPQELTLVLYNMLDGKPISKSVVRQGLLQQSRGG